MSTLQPSARSGNVAPWVVLAALAAGSITTLFYPQPIDIISERSQLSTVFVPEQVLMFNMVVNAGERNAYRVIVLVLLGLTLVVAAWWPRYAPTGRATPRARYIRVALPLLLGLATIISYTSLKYISRSGDLRLGLAALLLWPVVIVAGRYPSKPLLVVGYAVTIAYGLALTLPGLVAPIYIPQWLMWAVETHYSATLAQADRLAYGFRIGHEVSLSYGLTAPMLLAIYERHCGLLDFGAHIRLVQYSQATFLALAVLSFALWKPRNIIFLLVATLLVGPWVSTQHIAIYHPNQAGWRSLGLAVGVTALLLLRQQSLSRVACALGCVGSALIFFNPETGVCLTLGYAVYVFSQLRPGVVFNYLALLGKALLGALLTGALTLIAYRVGLGVWPDLGSSSLAQVSRFAQGYNSQQLYCDAFALLIFLHSAYLVARLALCRQRRALRPDESVELALACTILLWFPYFVNRPDPRNLWTYEYLYVFLAARFMAPATFAQFRQRGLRTICDPKFLAAFILVPAIITGNRLAWETHAAASSARSHTLLVSGVLMPEDDARELTEKVAFLKQQNPSDTLFLVCNSYSASLLTGRFLALPVQDSFTETATLADFDLLIATIQKLAPRQILIDRTYGPAFMPQDEVRSTFFDRLKYRLRQQYQFSRTSSGWDLGQKLP